MGRVQVLDKHTAELIAAGEVVERPASVIKELCENSIDAGADAVTVEIKNGGVSMIRITDNGEGMEREDVPVAFLRHATSKISCGGDLDAIQTLGFRGEALASICAVSRVELMTRRAESDVGTRYVIEGGDEVSCEDWGCAKGTTMIVRDIFYNTPARMKFLKKDVSEANAAESAVDKLALSHPEISFIFIRDGKQTLTTPGDGDMRSAIHAVYGREFTEGLIPVDYEYNGVRVSGYTSKPVCGRPNRGMQTFFINGRCCRSSSMQASLEEAYRGAIMVGKHPSCVLNVEMNCAAVDVNVHPAKLEVRFTNERPVTSAIYYAIKSALSENDERPELKMPEKKQPLFDIPETKHEQLSIENAVIENKKADEKPFVQTAAEKLVSAKSEEKKTAIDYTPKYTGAAASVRDSEDFNGAEVYTAMREEAKRSGFADDNGIINFGAKRGSIDIEVDETDGERLRRELERREEKNVAQEEAAKPEENKSFAPMQEEKRDNFSLGDWKMVGEAFDTYLILESGDELIIIDKHAAHERLIYERLKASRSSGETQYLLAPEMVVLPKNDYDAVLSNLELLLKAGFEIDDFGSGTVMVRSVPVEMTGTDVPSVVAEIAGRLESGMNGTFVEKLDNILHTVACRSAIKAHDKTAPEELAQLALTLGGDTSVRYCPHGRPISIKLTRKELEKSFGRI